MRKIIAAFSIAILSGLGMAQAACPNPTEEYVLYPPDFAFYPESLIKAYKEAKKEHQELLEKLQKCRQELSMLEEKKRELEERYGVLSKEVKQLQQEIAEREALMKRLAKLEAAVKSRLGNCESMLKRWNALPKIYTVKKGDTLWGIASKDYIYGDPWQWPLIYKANLDKIKNPHLIFPKQVLRIPRKITCKDIISARREALRTPPPKGVKPKKIGHPVKAEEVPRTATDYFLCKGCR